MGARKKHRAKPKLVGCPVGRPLNLEHPTCKSCPVDCSGKKGRGVHEFINTWYDETAKTLSTTAYLYSPNHWHGRPIHVYLEQKRKWQAIFAGTWALWGRQGEARRLIVVSRQVTSEDQLIMDDDNLRFCLKPVLDSLKHHGVVKDDSREFILEPNITQMVGSKQVVMIEVRDLL